MQKKIGVLAFAFGLREVEPSPCNQRLAEVVRSLIRERGRETLVISVSWEIAEGLEESEYDHIFSPDRDVYAGSEGNVGAAAPLFRERGVAEVYVVANPFLHLSKCVRLVRKAGFSVVPYKVPYIGFDKKSSQWWVRAPVRLLAYACMQFAVNTLKGPR